MTTALHALSLGLSLALVAACSSPSTETSAASFTMTSTNKYEYASLLPPANGPLVLQDDDGRAITLDVLLARLSKLTGVTFSIDSSASEQLKKDLVEITQAQSIAAQHVYPWAESILQQHGYVLGVLSGGDKPLVGVYGSRAPRSSQPSPISVPVGQIEECRQHPALLVTTVITLPNTDVRTLGNSLRGITSDPTGGQGILPVGNTNSVILMGSGRNVADLVAMLRTVDEQSATQLRHPEAAASTK